MLVPCGGGRTSPRTSPKCSVYFISFGIIGPIVAYFKNNGVLLMYILEGVSSVANFITAYEETQ